MSGSLDRCVAPHTPSTGSRDPARHSRPPRRAPRTAPKKVPVYFRCTRAGNRLVHVTLTISHRPGSLCSTLAALPKDGINLLAINITNMNGKPEALAHVFAEIAPPVSSDTLEGLLGAVPEVLHVRIQEDVDCRLIDDSYPLQLLETGRGLLFSAPAFVEAWDYLRDSMGSGGAVLLCMFGEHLGRQFADDIVGAVGRDFLRSNLAYAMRFWTSMGWGMVDLRHADLAAGRITVRVLENFECGGERTSAIPRSQLVRGMLIGLFSGILEAPMTCQETACLAQGRSYCEFVLERSPPKSPEPSMLPGG